MIEITRTFGNISWTKTFIKNNKPYYLESYYPSHLTNKKDILNFILEIQSKYKELKRTKKKGMNEVILINDNDKLPLPKEITLKILFNHINITYV